MGILGKIFSILIFLVAVATAAIVAYLHAQREDWHSRYVREVNQHYYNVQVMKAEVEAREIEIASLKALRTAADATITQLRAELTNKEEALKTANNQIIEMAARFEQLMAHASALNSNLQVLIEQMKTLQDGNNELRRQRNQAVAERQQAQTDAFDLRGKLEEAQKALANAETEYLKVASELARLTRIVDGLQERGMDVNVVPVPKLQGKVRGVAAEVGLVIISRGSDDGVKKGMKFTVYRASQFVCTLVIDGVDKDWAKGRIDLKQMDPRVGDDVTNEINQVGVAAK